MHLVAELFAPWHASAWFEPLERRLLLVASPIPSLNEVMLAFDAGNGRVVLAAPLSAEYAGAAAVRFDPDGTLDETFGDGGVVRLPDAGEVEDAVLDDRGRLLILTYPRAGRPGAVVRLTADGALDPGFGVNGRALMPYAADPQWGGSLAEGPDGRVVVARLLATAPSRYDQLEVTRFTRDGRADRSFDEDGVATLPPGGIDLGLVEVDRVGPRGDVALTAGPWFGRGGFVARLTGDGAPDPTFGGGDGVAPHPYQPDDEWDDVVTLPDGRLLRLREEEQTLLTRFNADGTLDRTFGDGGTVAFDDWVWHLPAPLADGRLLLEFPDAMMNRSFAVLAADGTFESSFGDNGRAVLPSDEGDWGSYMDFQLPMADGGFVAFRVVSPPWAKGNPLFSSRMIMDRLDAAGQPVDDFGDGGRVVVDFDMTGVRRHGDPYPAPEPRDPDYPPTAPPTSPPDATDPPAVEPPSEVGAPVVPALPADEPGDAADDLPGVYDLADVFPFNAGEDDELWN